MILPRRLLLTLRSKSKSGPPDRGDLSESAKRLREKVKWFVISEEMIPKNARVLAAVSGGQDSMAMLSILDEIMDDLQFRLTVGFFDHRLRASSESDRSIVESYANSCSLELHHGSEDVQALAVKNGESLEEAARKARYRFLFRLAEKIGADLIATAHTKNDQIETVFMRFLRGSGIRGLAGIPTRRGKIIRPLIQMDREETRLYCETKNVPFAIDPSNEDPQFFRNKIRLELLPFLRNIHPAVDESILRVSKNAQALIASIREKTRPLLKQHCKRISDREWQLNAIKLAGIDETSLVVLFGDLFAEEMQLDMDFTRAHYEQLLRLTRETTASGKQLSLPGLDAKREFENVIFTLHATNSGRPTPEPDEKLLPIPGEASFGDSKFKADILEREDLKDTSFSARANEAYFALDPLAPPIVIRRPKAGDRMQPFGMRGSKKLSDIYIDKKIPGRERKKTLLVADTREILWVIGAATSERGRIGEKTKKILKITVE